ncbi:unnamed protein product [Didymodactylos carnosus]|uniref:Uncharacterized protein n=1 Tax=Didymodactylos carnosus TaxID=1234261 RepID=A0A814FG92_9BILA|nr:unnamed protein product [Didymodactylos carnosus]CAF0979598.1 unnamed protein product [Didymodactylos carnosus]CAF3510112.1 unnamed protein product [Didymodactylos carnosus]CAF3752289.1 unnamed protein product [Didymodactylos carnosus]
MHSVSGFHTANNKEIKISYSSLVHVAKIFEQKPLENEIDDELLTKIVEDYEDNINKALKQKNTITTVTELDDDELNRAYDQFTKESTTKATANVQNNINMLVNGEEKCVKRKRNDVSLSPAIRYSKK